MLQSAGNLFVGQNANLTGINAPNLVFPHSMMSIDTVNRPIIRFTCQDNRQGINNFYNISLPIPQGITFGDSAQYSGLELGIAGKIAMDVASKGGNRQQAWEQAKKSAVDATSVFNVGRGLEMAQNVSVAKSFAAGAAHAGGMFVNKNVVTNFGGIGTRGFSYTFKLIAGTREEAQTLQQMQRVFRLGLYPDGSMDQLNMPPRWLIKFIDLSTGRELSSVPKLYECFLRDLSIVVNPSSNMWRVDNSPLEIDLMISFVETKALTASDIDSLEKNGYTKALDTGAPLLYPRATPVSSGARSPVVTSGGASSAGTGVSASAEGFTQAQLDQNAIDAIGSINMSDTGVLPPLGTIGSETLPSFL
jgi:hypothetical protein